MSLELVELRLTFCWRLPHRDLLAHWKIEYRPKRKLLFLVVEIIIGIGLGWVPGASPLASLLAPSSPF